MEACDESPMQDAEQQPDYYGNYNNNDQQNNYYSNYNNEQQQQQNAAYYANYYNGNYGYYNGNEQNGYYNYNNGENQENYYNNTGGQHGNDGARDNYQGQQNGYYDAANAEGQQTANYANYNGNEQDANYMNYTDGEQDQNAYYGKTRNKKKTRRSGHKQKMQDDTEVYQVPFKAKTNEPYHPYDYYLPYEEVANEKAAQKARRGHKRNYKPGN